MLRFERDGEQPPAEHLPLLEEVDRAEIGGPGAVLDRLPRDLRAHPHERRLADRLAEELVHRLLCRPCSHTAMVAALLGNVKLSSPLAAEFSSRRSRSVP